MAKHDIVIVGGGHNGLTVAAYLAKAGEKVCVLEARPEVGGGVVTREATVPGFKHDLFSTAHIFMPTNPLIKDDELKLQSKYGLKYLTADPAASVIFSDGNAITFYRDVDKTCESIAKVSRRDADAYRKYVDWAVPNLDMLLMGMYSPPPPFSALVSMLEKSEQGQDLLMALLKSPLDVAEDWFESDKVKIALTRCVTENLISPKTKGCGLGVPALTGMFHKYGLSFPEGGSYKLIVALENCIKDLGGTIRTSSPVKKVKVEKGEAKGVILESGEEIEARKAVVSALHVKQLFLQMIEETDLPPNFLTKVKRLRHSDYSGMNSSIALNEALRYKIGGDIDRSWLNLIAPSDLEAYLKEFDALQYGYPSSDTPMIICTTLHDKTRTPQGKHTLFLYHLEPYHLKEGGAARWDQIQEQVADDMIMTLRKYTVNMGDENILGRKVMSPIEIERENPAFVEGDFMHLGSQLFQSLSNRPLIGWNYKTPVKKLYLTGSCTPPGGGIMCGGRAAVQVIMEDLGINFRKVIS
jgi:phytoene dehydrogenase-like protein